MKEICENIYKKSRKSAGLEQIEAADKLGVSARSLQNYESELNVTLPPLDIVRNMCILYNDKGLAYKHIKKSPMWINYKGIMALLDCVGNRRFYD